MSRRVARSQRASIDRERRRNGRQTLSDGFKHARPAEDSPTLWSVPLVTIAAIGALVRIQHLSQLIRYDESVAYLDFAAGPWRTAVTWYTYPNNHVFRTGVGKTHLAPSLAVAAAERGHRVYFTTLADLLHSPEDAQSAGRLTHRLRTLGFPSLMVIWTRLSCARGVICSPAIYCCRYHCLCRRLWLLPTNSVGMIGFAQSGRSVRAALKIELRRVLDSRRGSNALVFMGETAPERLIRRLWGLGISRPEAVRLVTDNDNWALLTIVSD